MATCPHGHDNPDGQRFCGECGTQIVGVPTEVGSRIGDFNQSRIGLSTPDARRRPAASGQPARTVNRRSRRRFLMAGIAIAVIVLLGATALIWRAWLAHLTIFPRTPMASVAAPDAALANSPAVAATQPSVVKIRAMAPSCQKVLEGSGFVLSPDRVMTNAHVVAGATTVNVEASGNPYDATVVSYDPIVDIAILSVPNLPVKPLAFADTQAPAGTGTIVMGYPGGGAFIATPARIRELIELEGPDIYRTATIRREVYTLRAAVDQGNSGGPLIDVNGRVLGVVFGVDVDDNDTGFVLTAKEVAAQLAHVGDTAPVATGQCVS
jgi:S1-C subfamily serine protease